MACIKPDLFEEIKPTLEDIINTEIHIIPCPEEKWRKAQKGLHNLTKEELKDVLYETRMIPFKKWSAYFIKDIQQLISSYLVDADKAFDKHKKFRALVSRELEWTIDFIKLNSIYSGYKKLIINRKAHHVTFKRKFGGHILELKNGRHTLKEFIITDKNLYEIENYNYREYKVLKEFKNGKFRKVRKRFLEPYLKPKAWLDYNFIEELLQ